MSRALVELQKALQRAVGEKVLAEQQRKLEREAARQEAAVARTEALQLRGEREAALGRLHAALEASHTEQAKVLQSMMQQAVARVREHKRLRRPGHGARAAPSAAVFTRAGLAACLSAFKAI